MNLFWYYFFTGALSLFALFFLRKNNKQRFERKNDAIREIVIYYMITFLLWPIIIPLLAIFFIIEKTQSRRDKKKFYKLFTYEEKNFVDIYKKIEVELNRLIEIQAIWDEVKVSSDNILREEFISCYERARSSFKSLEKSDLRLVRLLDLKVNKEEKEEKLKPYFEKFENVSNWFSEHQFRQDPNNENNIYPNDLSTVFLNYFNRTLLYHRDFSNKETELAIKKSDWKVCVTPNFKKKLNKLDEKLRKKSLGAINSIILNPISVIPNTLKPLNNNKKGLWSYRVGNFRLLYEPKKADQIIYFIKIEDRSRVYKN